MSKNNDEIFNGLLIDAISNAKKDKPDNSTSLISDNQLSNNYDSEDEHKRVQAITEIIKGYEKSYSNKITFQKTYRIWLFWICSAVIVAFTVTVIGITAWSLRKSASLDLSGVAMIITAVISFVSAIIGLLTIITKYCFPEKDDEYIVRIVETSLKNHLETIKETNRSAEARGNSNKKE